MINKFTHGGARPGAGRPPVGRIFFPVRIAKGVAAEIDKLCFERNPPISRGSLIEEKFPLRTESICAV